MLEDLCFVGSSALLGSGVATLAWCVAGVDAASKWWPIAVLCLAGAGTLGAIYSILKRRRETR